MRSVDFGSSLSCLSDTLESLYNRANSTMNDVLPISYHVVRFGSKMVFNDTEIQYDNNTKGNSTA